MASLGSFELSPEVKGICGGTSCHNGSWSSLPSSLNWVFRFSLGGPQAGRLVSSSRLVASRQAPRARPPGAPRGPRKASCGAGSGSSRCRWAARQPLRF